MSDLDRDNLREESQPLNRLNPSTIGHSRDGKTRNKKVLCIILGIVILIGVILAIVLPLTLRNSDGGDPFLFQEHNPYTIDKSTINETVWKSKFVIKQPARNLQSVPNTFYRLQDGQVNGASYKPADPTKIPSDSNNQIASNVRFNIDLIDNFQVRVNIMDHDQSDLEQQRYRVQDDVFTRPILAWEARLSQVGFKYADENENFYFSFGDIYSEETILTTYNRKLLISDRYSEIGFILPTSRCFGLGQRNGQFQLQQGSYSLWARARDDGLPQDDQLGGKNGNHIHPFIMCQTAVNKDFFGMFFAGTGPQAFEVVKFGGTDKMVLNYISLAGPLEMYFIMRGSPDDIIKKYHGLIGYSQMPPYYALGYFQGSNSYDSLQKVQAAINSYSSLGMSLEGVFVENYNQGPHQTFTINSQSFAGFADYIKTLHNNYQHVILGASFAISSDAPIFTEADQNQCLVQRSIFIQQEPLQSGASNALNGTLDQVTVYYIDAFHNNTYALLSDIIPAFDQSVNGLDGLLLKDTHLPNHINGEIPLQVQTVEVKKRVLSGVSESSIGSIIPYLLNETESDVASTYYLPFIPAWTYSGYLDNMTISLNATHGGSARNLANIYVKNGHAHRALKQVQNVLTDSSIYNQTTGKRPLIFTEATWAGSGALGAGIITDLYRSWDNLKFMISQAMALSMYGISNTMVDSCGSLGPQDEQLCARWMQIAVFMPMVRNYYNATYLDPQSGNRTATYPTEPNNIKLDDYEFAFASALAQRLMIGRYIYSQMYRSHREGGSLVRPLFFDFPKDDQAYDNVDTTFMLGDSIKVSPILEKGIQEGNKYQSYFPQGIWIDINNPTNVIDTTNGGQMVDLTATNASTNIHQKGGTIIPYQYSPTLPLKTTYDYLTKLGTTIRIARDFSGNYAQGYLLIDDGISNMSYFNEEYTFWNIRYAEKSINFFVGYGNFLYEPEGLMIQYLDHIEIVNAQDLNTTNFACFFDTSMTPVRMIYEYNNDTNILTLKPSQDKPNVKFNDIRFIKFGDNDNEPNVCDTQSAFTYTGAKVDAESNDTFWRFNIQSKQGTKFIAPLVATFQLLDNKGTLNVEITTQTDYEGGKKDLYRSPVEAYDPSNFNSTLVTRKLSEVLQVSSDPFAYQIFTDSTDASTMIWKSDPNRLYLSPYMLMDSGLFQMNLANNKPLLGMGERAGNLIYQNESGGIHSRYTFDQANPIDDGLPPGRNMYGFQPFYAYQASTNNWVGVFDGNPYATDYILYSDIGDGKTTQIHKISIGGVISKFFFVGEKIDDVIKSYQKLVGNPTVPPLWAFGWHQCRFGWVTSGDWWNVYESYLQNDLPLDTMWADIDYMDDYKLFTISQKSYPNLAELVLKVKQDNRTFVPIMDAGVAVRENQGYQTLDTGLQKNVFIQRSDKQAPLTAGVWCGNAYFPDFFKPETVEWWKSNFDQLYEDLGLKFDGVWLDENEATNFCNGYCKPEERPYNSLRNKPFYIPGARDLEDKALGVDGFHESINRYEYDVHNLFSLKQSQATAEYLNKKLGQGNARPYVLTRANFPGIGKYAHHWMGDNWSTVEYMAYSVDGVMSYNLFGLPFMGSDICGFNGDASPDLCARWHILGSLYPFARNHNQNATKSQEPYRFNQTFIPGSTNRTYTDVIRTALVNRYSFIKYYYSQFMNIGTFGGSFFKPLFYEYDQDPQAFVDIQKNILLGDALKASIQTQTLDFVNSPNSTFYFPTDRWCQILPKYDVKMCYDTSTDNKTQVLNTGLEDYYIHLRSGYILPYQDATKNNVRKTKDLENYQTDLYVLAESANEQMTMDTSSMSAVARGYIYYDDGITFNNPGRFDFYLTNDGSGQFTFKVVKTIFLRARDNLTHEQIGNIVILWASKSGMNKIKSATLTTTTGGATVTLIAPVVDTGNDSVTIQVTSTDKTQVFSFWDIDHITLT